MFKDIFVPICLQSTVKPMRKKNTKQLKDPFSALEVMNLINIFPL